MVTLGDIDELNEQIKACRQAQAVLGGVVLMCCRLVTDALRFLDSPEGSQRELERIRVLHQVVEGAIPQIWMYVPVVDLDEFLSGVPTTVDLADLGRPAGMTPPPREPRG